MSENADLKEKNQELEHVIQQLQFETETISNRGIEIFFKLFYAVIDESFIVNS